jgi:hypothetical protein
MRKMFGTLGVLALAASLGAQEPAPPPQPQQSQAPQYSPRERREAMQSLVKNLEKAMANANLTEDQRARLDKAKSALQEAGRARRRGGSATPADPEKMRTALRDLYEISQSGAFRAEDKEAIRKDLEKLREMRGGQRGAGRRPRRA